MSKIIHSREDLHIKKMNVKMCLQIIKLNLIALICNDIMIKNIKILMVNNNFSINIRYFNCFTISANEDNLQSIIVSPSETASCIS